MTLSPSQSLALAALLALLLAWASLAVAGLGGLGWAVTQVAGRG